MPIFEYNCQACGRAFEELIVRAADASTVACPRCGASEVRRLLSATAARTSSAGVGAASRPARGCGPVG